MKSIPKSVTLGGHKVAVKRVGGIASIEADGRAHWGDKTIELDRALTGAELGEVFIHECVHMVSECYALGLDEQTVRTLGVGLQQMLNLRPK